MSQSTKILPHRSKGKPRSFNRSAALDRALSVFWRRGYEPASISELCAAMEINPPSLYAAFGNKAQLFMEAVNHYEAVYWDTTWEQMAEAGDLHDAIRHFFSEAVNILTAQDVPCGCLVILAATNVSAEGEEVNAALRALRKEGRDFLVARIQRGVDEKQLPACTDVLGLGSALNTVLEGMSLQVRDGVSRDELARTVPFALRMLPQRGEG